MAIKCGILLTNIGTPDSPTPRDVRRYLKEFLSDTRVIEIPRIIWWPILHGFILRFRPKKSAELYRKIWTEQGSPLLVHTQQIATALEEKLLMPVAVGMHYGNPSIKSALASLRKQNVARIVILPLYPQYSATTTASTFDHVARELKSWRVLPEIRTIHDYADDKDYISAIANSIRAERSKTNTAPHLLFSFHGIPKRCVDLGDPYPERCLLTARLVAAELKLSSDDYTVTFQSRLGKAEWLKPYTDAVLKELPKQDIKDIQVVCPGFAVDCLETLEEIAIRGKEQFLSAGGRSFNYIPALNNQAEHIQFLAKLL